MGSLPDGTGSVQKSLAANYELLDKFEKIYLWFDDDERGREATAKAVEILPPGKVWLIRPPEGCKDANEVLTVHGKAAITKAYWDAKCHRPDGIVLGEDMDLTVLMEQTDRGVDIPWPKLNTMMLGLRPAELTLLTAGSGIGKSTLARELAYHLAVVSGEKIGNIFLEERNAKTAQAFIAIHNNIPLGRLRNDKSLLTEAQWRTSKETVIDGRMRFYDHFGSLQAKSLVQKITYFARVLGCSTVILDHISIVVSGLESGSEGERKDIDMLMTSLQTVIQQTGVRIIAIVHLKRRGDGGFNEGGKISLTDLRGSASLEQLSDNVLALERDQQGDNPCLEDIRVLKCRETGYTGLADKLLYNRQTGRLELVEDSPFDIPDAKDLKDM